MLNSIHVCTHYRSKLVRKPACAICNQLPLPALLSPVDIDIVLCVDCLQRPACCIKHHTTILEHWVLKII